MLKKNVITLAVCALSIVNVPAINVADNFSVDSFSTTAYAAYYPVDEQSMRKALDRLAGNWRASDGKGISFTRKGKGNNAEYYINGEKVSSMSNMAGGGGNYGATFTVLSKGWLPGDMQINVEHVAEAGKPPIHPQIHYKGKTYYRCDQGIDSGCIYLGNNGYGNANFLYSVDKKTLIDISDNDNPRYNVYVYEYDQYAKMQYNYTFKKDKDVWKYKWAQADLGTTKSSDGWKKVSESRLANDILYAILHG